jgi:small subunit ribosomal protein S17
MSTPRTERTPRTTVVGTVVSDKMQKTIAVREDRLVRHARYGKFLKRSTIYKAHDEREQAELGDEVEIAFARRLSKTKSWRLVRIVRKGKAEAVRGEADREAIAARPTLPTPPPTPPRAAPEGKAKAAPESSS